SVAAGRSLADLLHHVATLLLEREAAGDAKRRAVVRGDDHVDRARVVHRRRGDDQRVLVEDRGPRRALGAEVDGVADVLPEVVSDDLDGLLAARGAGAGVDVRDLEIPALTASTGTEPYERETEERRPYPPAVHPCL